MNLLVRSTPTSRNERTEDIDEGSINTPAVQVRSPHPPGWAAGKRRTPRSTCCAGSSPRQSGRGRVPKMCSAKNLSVERGDGLARATGAPDEAAVLSPQAGMANANKIGPSGNGSANGNMQKGC